VAVFTDAIIVKARRAGRQPTGLRRDGGHPGRGGRPRALGREGAEGAVFWTSALTDVKNKRITPVLRSLRPAEEHARGISPAVRAFREVLAGIPEFADAGFGRARHRRDGSVTWNLLAMLFRGMGYRLCASGSTWLSRAALGALT